MKRTLLLILACPFLHFTAAFAQDTAQMAGELAKAYGVDASEGIMGFSIPALFGAMVALMLYAVGIILCGILYFWRE